MTSVANYLRVWWKPGLERRLDAGSQRGLVLEPLLLRPALREKAKAVEVAAKKAYAKALPYGNEAEVAGEGRMTNIGGWYEGWGQVTASMLTAVSPPATLRAGRAACE